MPQEVVAQIISSEFPSYDRNRSQDVRLLLTDSNPGPVSHRGPQKARPPRLSPGVSRTSCSALR